MYLSESNEGNNINSIVLKNISLEVANQLMAKLWK